MDVLVQQRKHLRLLKRAHTPRRRCHEHPHALFAPHGIFGRAAGIAARGTQNVELLASPGQFVFKEIAQQLHGHVFESQRWAIGKGLQIQPLF